MADSLIDPTGQACTDMMVQLASTEVSLTAVLIWHCQHTNGMDNNAADKRMCVVTTNDNLQFYCMHSGVRPSRLLEVVVLAVTAYRKYRVPTPDPLGRHSQSFLVHMCG